MPDVSSLTRLFVLLRVVAKPRICQVGSLPSIYTPLFSLCWPQNLLLLLSVLSFVLSPFPLSIALQTQDCLYLPPLNIYLLLNHSKTNMASQAFASPDIYGLVIKHVPEMTKPTDPKYCELKQADNAEIFTICHRAVGGETNLWYLPNDNTATCVINSINICLAMLRNEEVRNAFTEIAASYSQTYPTAWFLQEASPEHKGDMNRVTDGFLQKILEKFPIVWVDNTVENPRLMAAAMRREWDGNFRSCNQCISLNGAVCGNLANFEVRRVLAQADQMLEC